jgi:protocatechuate 3,4-dioxygenase beta subunit
MTRSASLIVGLFLCCVSTVLGQISLGTGSIEGTVLDAGGAAVPHAEISVRNINTGQVRSSSTDAAGRYTVLSLLTGQYGQGGWLDRWRSCGHIYYSGPPGQAMAGDETGR